MAETETPATTGKKIVLDYQATDVDGNPIGYPTHLEADTYEELSKLQMDAHISAMRLADRYKNMKPTPKAPEALAPRQLTTDEEFQAVTELLQPGKARQAFRKLLESELPITQLEQDGKALREATARTNRLAAVYQFKQRHPDDFYDCDANGKVLSEYLGANNLEWTPDNLEIAFAMSAHKLAKAPASPGAPTNVAPPQPEANSSERRPSATPGMQPSQFSGTPQPKPKGLTRADYIKMGRENPEEFKRHLANPKLRAVMDKVLGQ